MIVILAVSALSSIVSECAVHLMMKAGKTIQGGELVREREYNTCIRCKISVKAVALMVSFSVHV